MNHKSSEVLLPNYSSHWNNKFHWSVQGHAAPHGKQPSNPVPREAPDGQWPWTRPSSLQPPDAPVPTAHGEVQSLETEKNIWWSYHLCSIYIRCIVLYNWILHLQTCVIFCNVFTKLGQSLEALCGHFIRLLSERTVSANRYEIKQPCGMCLWTLTLILPTVCKTVGFLGHIASCLTTISSG